MLDELLKQVFQQASNVLKKESIQELKRDFKVFLRALVYFSEIRRCDIKERCKNHKVKK